jgi:MinD-like ATPase involved in chromosome partitioning or flagellar assembly
MKRSSGLPVLVALAGLPEEQLLVAALDRAGAGTTVVRRCVDLADLLAAATTRTADVAVVAADLRRLDREAVARLAAAGLAVVAVTRPGDAEAGRRMRQLGVVDLVPADAAVDEIVATVCAAPQGALVQAEEQQLLPVPEEPSPSHGRPPGQVVAVWGPTGAPGRTTVAVTVAAEAARRGMQTLLVDADTYGAAVAQVLGLLDESPGLLAAVRAANAGQLDEDSLARTARQVAPGLCVLSGSPRPDRWSEVRAAALEVVLEAARSLAELTVVDVGFCLEQDEELVYDTAAPRRNAATLGALAAADVVLAVGSADPVGLQRLLRSLPEVRAHTAGEVHVVLNRVPRPSSDQFSNLVARHAGVRPVASLPYDRSACEHALSLGRSLTEVAPRAPLRLALAKLTQLVLGASVAVSR